MKTPSTTGIGSTPLPAIIPPTAKTAKRNIRSLATLADEICALRARSIFELGELLLEAKAACEPGKWSSWLKTEVDYSDDTASRYMAAAQLGNRFRKLRNLNLAKSTIYALVNLDKEEREALGLEAVNDPDLTDEDSTESSHLSAIIDELAERSAGGKLTAAAAKDVFRIVPLRAKFGEFPDATLFALEQIDGEPWAETATVSGRSLTRRRRPSSMTRAAITWSVSTMAGCLICRWMPMGTFRELRLSIEPLFCSGSRRG